ncbi:MAG: hypothetical protein ACF8Q5_11215 [Phycisphaerales bacterium JB040]
MHARTALAAIAALAGTALAGPVGTDDASNYTLAEFQAGADKATTGDAFGAWDIFKSYNGSGFVDPYLGDSRSLDGSGTGIDINTGGRSFQLFATESNYVDAKRTFTGALAVGQTFSMDWATNWIGSGFQGVDLTTGGGAFTSIFNFNAGGGSFNIDTKGAGTGDGGPFAGEDAYSYFHLAFTQTSLTGGDWLIERTAQDGTVLTSAGGTYGGLADGFKVYAGSQFGGAQDDVYFNNLAIVPAPATIAPLALAGLACTRRGR